MDVFNQFKKFLKRERYTQAFNGAPIFLNHAAYSGLIIKKLLGFGYSGFGFDYKEDYGEMYYLTADFKRIWKVIKDKLARDPDYLVKKKRQYEEIFKESERLFKYMDNLNLKKIGNEELIELLKKCARAQIDSVGIGHLVDAIGLELEKEFKKKLFSEISDKKNFNKCFNQLTAPSKPSFIAKEENELLKISSLSPVKRKKERIRKSSEEIFLDSK